MKFDTYPIEQALGLILAHAIKGHGIQFKKGRRLERADLDQLRAAGITEVAGALLEPFDVDENSAAAAIAGVIAGPHLYPGEAFTGRVNLFARRPGLLGLDASAILQINQIDEAITLATLPALASVQADQMVATVKIIPFAVAKAALDQAVCVSQERAPVLEILPFQSLEATLIQTRLEGTKETVLDKTVATTARRLAALGSRLGAEIRCVHRADALAKRLAAVRGDLVLIAGASAITDRKDVLPAALEAAGGEILHLGMPVDPGNLLLLGRLGGRPVLGLPGCARSPKLNGFDWVLQRLAAGLDVGPGDITSMGIGGLLMEIPSRPQPREGQPSAAPKVAGIVLAAGRSARMGEANKLVEKLNHKPLVTYAVDALLGSRADPVIVVTGHEAAKVEDALAGRPATLVHNPDHALGLSSSLRVALDAVPKDCAGVVIALGDMPRITTAAIDRMIAAFNPVEGRGICVPIWQGKRGNPVLFARHYMGLMREISGDVGARHLIGEHDDDVCEIEMDDESALIDIDTPAALAEIRATMKEADADG